MNNKSIAVDILKEYASSYSRTDIDRLAARLDEREKAVVKETAEKIFDAMLEKAFIGLGYVEIGADALIDIAKQFGLEVEE